MKIKSLMYDTKRPIPENNNLQKIKGTALQELTGEKFNLVFFPAGWIMASFKAEKPTMETIVDAEKKINGILKEMGINGGKISSKRMSVEIDGTFLSGLFVAKSHQNRQEHVFLRHSIYEIKGEFATKRILEHAGLEIGKGICKEKNPKNKLEALKAIKDYFKKNGLGHVEAHKIKAKLPGSPEFKIRIYGGPYAGMPKIGQFYTVLEGAIIKGVMINYMQSLNTFVVQKKGWGMGNTFAEFDFGLYSQ